MNSILKSSIYGGIFIVYFACLSSLGSSEDWRVVIVHQDCVGGLGMATKHTNTIAKVVSLKTGRIAIVKSGDSVPGEMFRIFVTKLETNGVIAESMSGERVILPFVTDKETKKLNDEKPNNPAHATGVPAPDR